MHRETGETVMIRLAIPANMLCKPELSTFWSIDPANTSILKVTMDPYADPGAAGGNDGGITGFW